MSASVFTVAADGLIGALFTGGVSGLIFWRQGRSRATKLDDAWRKQADELDARLTDQYDRASKQYEDRIGYLERSLTGCQSEQRRLQRLIGALQQRGGT